MYILTVWWAVPTLHIAPPNLQIIRYIRFNPLPAFLVAGFRLGF